MASLGLYPRPELSSPPRPFLNYEAHLKVHDIFARFETRQGRMYRRREEDIKEVGQKEAPSTETLFHGEPLSALAVVKPHACAHVVVKSTNAETIRFTPNWTSISTGIL